MLSEAPFTSLVTVTHFTSGRLARSARGRRRRARGSGIDADGMIAISGETCTDAAGTTSGSDASHR